MLTWEEYDWKTYSPVVNWLSVRALLIISILHDLDIRALDFVLAFSQVDLYEEVYMGLRFGFTCGAKREYVLKLNKFLYGLCQ
mmetsp:Transcript_17586/g.24799  ORF Transcript_17586/g.24799 Transcript_17586/m.24799 type:complete len:83 (+) Transcript_17586:2579-2827(+)